MTSVLGAILSTCNYNEDFYVTQEEEEKYMDLIKKTFPHVEIEEVEKVNNKYLYAAFMLKKTENPNYRIIELIHSTAAENVNSIEKDNLDWRLVRRAKYGYGVSFSENADYANYHSSWSGGSRRAYIICDVLVDSIQNDDACEEIPEGDNDTVQSSNDYVYVKFDDFTFYPKYVLYYEKPSGTLSTFYRSFRMGLY